MTVTFDAFISYRHSDRDAVEAVARALREREVTPFLDRWHLAAGRPWPERLEEVLAGCRSVVAFVGPLGLGEWQKREIYSALDRQSAADPLPVIPVLLPGVEDPALGFLGLNTWVDLRADPADAASLDILTRAIRGEPPGAPDEIFDPKAEICPYRGLEPFREEDAAFFFGRDSLTSRLVEAVGARDLVAVVGASGSGKSSVVRAGLSPALRRGADGRVWDILTMQPGPEPLQALARALDPPSEDASLAVARAHVNQVAGLLRDGAVTLAQLAPDRIAAQTGTDRLLLVVDQFEELATQTKNPADAERFIDLLLEATGSGGPLTVIATLRSDFYTALVRRRDLSDRLTGGVQNIGPVSREAPEGEVSELEEIIRRPAEEVGLDFDDGLVARILGDAGDEPGRLPLLEYLLTELWRRRARRRLTHAAYDDLGGVSGAIARRAEEAYARLGPEAQVAARRLFLSLVRPGEGREDTRARARFPDDPVAAEVARRFADAGTRLLVTGEDAVEGLTVEVSHEALIRNWRTLRQWVDANRETLRARDRVAERMARWREAGEPDDLLLPRGLELEEGKRLLAADGDVSMDEIRDYVTDSIAAETAAVAAEQREVEERERLLKEQAEQSEKLARQRGWTTRLAIGAAVIVAGLAAAALWQFLEADAAKDVALASEQAAVASQRKADAAAEQARTAQILAEEEKARAEVQLKQANTARSRFLAGKAADLAASGDHGTATGLALRAIPAAYDEGRPEQSEIPEAALALDTSLRGLRERAVLRGHEGGVLSAAFSPDGAHIVTASGDSTARVWKVYPTYDALFAAATEVVERLQPLSEAEECQYYLRTEGCD